MNDVLIKDDNISKTPDENNKIPTFDKFLQIALERKGLENLSFQALEKDKLDFDFIHIQELSYRYEQGQDDKALIDFGQILSSIAAQRNLESKQGGGLRI